MRRFVLAPRFAAGLSCVAMAAVGAPAAQAAGPTTAWSGGKFNVDTANLVRRSDISLGQPPLQPKQSMDLGNGVFGVATWAANGFTAQLNRVDTFPDHRSAGQLVIPGLAAMTSAPDYQGTVDLYDAIYRQSGGGMTATTYVRADKDEIVVDVTGADPASTQTASVNLQSGRHPTAAANGSIATLGETWVDDATYTGGNKSAGGGTGKTFGSLAALTAGGRSVTASAPDANTVRVSFNPNADGSFRVVVGVPHWAGGDAAATAATLLGDDASASSSSLRSGHLDWWHSYWGRVGLVKLSSTDGVADYMENIRNVYLYTAAASERGQYPSSQAGVNDLFNFSRDSQQWGGGDYWFWNDRMQIAANISSGATELNSPFFIMYGNDVASLEAWTRMMWPMSQGYCLPETMRFDGTGYYIDGANGNNSCDSSTGTSFNKLTLTSGAELASWVWRQYQDTDDKAFLQRFYPLISEPAKFLLSYSTVGSDGKLHTYPSNAHETQWGVHDPITDISAMKMLYPIAVQAAQTLGVDPDLVTQLQTAIPEILDFPRTDKATHRQLKTAADDADGNTVLGFSSDASAGYHNNENLDLEPVWPYNLIGDTSPLFDLAKVTYNARQFKNSNSWTYDPVQAARLDMGDQVAAGLKASTQTFQVYPSGMAAWNVRNLSEPYDEHSGVTTLAINEALATDYDGLLRIAPAVPSTWTAEGTIFLQHQSKVHVQVQNGTVTTAVVASGSDHDMLVRNPWLGHDVQVVDGGDETTVVVGTTNADTFTIHAQAGKTYVIQQPSAPLASETAAPLTGTPATAARHLTGTSVEIGLDVPGYQLPPPCAIPTGPTLLAWDPTSGDTVRDWSGYNRTGTFAKGAAYATDGPTGSAAVLSGGNYLTAGPTKLGFLREITLAAELNITAGSSYRRILDWKTPSGGDGDGILVDLTPSGGLRVITAGSTVTVNSAIPTGTWISLAVTIAQNGTENVYVNGNRVGGGTFASPGINGCNDGATLRFGADQTGGQAITAEIDRAAIFTTALPAADVARWQSLAVPTHTDVPGSVGGQVPATLALTLGQPASFGAFAPGVAADYTSSLAATVTSTAGDATLSVADPSATAPGHLVNGSFALPSPLQLGVGSALAALGANPMTLVNYTNPVSNDVETISLKQSIGSTDPLRSGNYAKTLTFTLSTTTP